MRYIHSCTACFHFPPKEQNLGSLRLLKYGPKQGAWGKSGHLPQKRSPDITKIVYKYGPTQKEQLSTARSVPAPLGIPAASLERKLTFKQIK